jgi:hypothetical protein
VRRAACRGGWLDAAHENREGFGVLEQRIGGRAMALGVTAVAVAAAIGTRAAAGAEVPNPAPAVAGVSPVSPALRQGIDRILQARPGYPALAKHDPETYAAVVDAVARSPYASAAEGVILAVARSHLATAAPRYLAKGKNQSAELYSRNMVAQLRVSGPQVGDACYALLAPDDQAAARLATIDLGTLDDSDLEYLGEAITTSATDPQALPDPEGLAKRLRSITAVVRQRLGGDVDLVTRLGEPGIDHAKACQATNAVLVAILRKTGSVEPALVGPMFRYVYSLQAARQPMP